MPIIISGQETTKNYGFQKLELRDDDIWGETLNKNFDGIDAAIKAAALSAGQQGPPGEKGDPGAGLSIINSYGTEAQLRAEHPTGVAGEAYLIGDHLYIWLADLNDWYDFGQFQGPKGEKGDTGPTGSTGPKGDTGATGPAGPLGPAGKDGTGISINGNLTNPSQLPSTGATGEAYLINGSLWVWIPSANTWQDVGSIQGPKGDKGDTGAAGAQGPKGDAGTAGPQGSPGSTGATGATGLQGLQGPQGPQGSQGPSGPTGATGATGATGPNSVSTTTTSTITNNEFLRIISGKVASGTGAGANANCNIGSGAAWNSIGSDNTAVGNIAMGAASSGDGNVCVGRGAAYWTKSGAGVSSISGGTFIGRDSGPLVAATSNETAIGYAAKGMGNNTVTLGNTSVTKIYAQVAAITALSDRRIKEDIEPADTDLCLDAVKNLPVTRFKYKDFTGTHVDNHVTGWLADDVEKIFPKAVSQTDQFFPVLSEDGEQEYEEVKALVLQDIDDDEPLYVDAQKSVQYEAEKSDILTAKRAGMKRVGDLTRGKTLDGIKGLETSDDPGAAAIDDSLDASADNLVDEINAELHQHAEKYRERVPSQLTAKGSNRRSVKDGPMMYEMSDNKDTVIVKREKTFVMEGVKDITMTEALPTLWGAVQALLTRIEFLENKIAVLEAMP